MGAKFPPGLVPRVDLTWSSSLPTRPAESVLDSDPRPLSGHPTCSVSEAPARCAHLLDHPDGILAGAHDVGAQVQVIAPCCPPTLTPELARALRAVLLPEERVQSEVHAEVKG